MKLTINFGENDNRNPLFYALLAGKGNSIPTTNASQWFYEVGKALYYLSESDLLELVKNMQTEDGINIQVKS